MRFLADIPDEDISELDALARRNNRSRAAEVREAVRLYLLSRKGNDWIARGSGYWKDREDIGDAVDYQRTMRNDRGAG
jgi:metal-responsive CopG/Arc/MetJ family transcriptional regulator